MSLKEKIFKDLSAVIKTQDKKKLKALRFLQAAIKNKEIELRPNEIQDADIISVIKKQSKQIQESLEHYKNAEGYGDQVKEEEFNLSIIKSYLPEEMSEDQMKKIVQEVINELKPQSMKDMGAVMKAVVEKTKGGADGKVLSQLVREHLQKI